MSPRQCPQACPECGADCKWTTALHDGYPATPHLCPKGHDW
jgi:hypothetical protein